MRTDAEQARHRNDRDATRRGRGVDAFSGRENPELYLPFELFQHLVRTAYLSPAREDFRKIMWPAAASIGAQEDFWDRLMPEIAPYVAELAREQALAQAMHEAKEPQRGQLIAELQALQARNCGRRADAHAAAGRAFGDEWFDQFLYVAVAPNLSQVARTLPSAEDLRRAEQGCR